jgi:glycogen debranching enzyme
MQNLQRVYNISWKVIFISCFFYSCQTKREHSYIEIFEQLQGLTGKSSYLNSPFLTSGNQIYMVGHQDGSFPDLGWHVEGEMGGIWNHPIKLMDGFIANITKDNTSYCLNNADYFINYPVGNQHVFQQSLIGLEIKRVQFVPEDKQGLIISFEITNLNKSENEFLFDFTGYVDLRPVWLGEKTEMIDHPDELNYYANQGFWHGKDKGNEWHTVFGSTVLPDHSYIGTKEQCKYQPKGNGVSGSLSYQIVLKPKEKTILNFYISGSTLGLDEAKLTYEDLKENGLKYLQDKITLFKNIASTSQISIPDKELEKTFEWVKYNTQWLYRSVPTIGKGYAAGMPDYPWWFGVDNEYTLKGAIMTGQRENVYATIDLIYQISNKTNGNGRVVHEVSTNGAVFNPGNINETPQFASLIWWVYNWTGDREFLEKYFPFIQKGLKWLVENNDLDQNLFPEGYGMMEIHGLKSEMIDVAVYSQKAFADASLMADVLGKKEIAKEYANKAEQLKLKINKDFWVEEYNSYADFIGTGSKALEMIDAAIYRADTLKKPWAVTELKTLKSQIEKTNLNEKKGFVMFHNWVVNTPMEMGIASQEQAIKALDKGSRFVNPFGVFVTGIDRDDSSSYADGSFQGSKIFSYTGAVMTLPTGVQAIAENNYGRPDHALKYLKSMTKSFGYALPGSIYEVSPDYGMMTQAWTLYSYAVPLVSQFFGIQPEAGKKTINIQPLMPSDWKDAAIKNVIIGDNVIHMNYNKTEKGIRIELEQSKPDWKIIYGYSKTYSHLKINGEQVTPIPTKGNFQTISSKGKNIVFELEN